MAEEAAQPKEIKVAHDELSLLHKEREEEEGAAGMDVKKVAETDDGVGDSEKPDDKDDPKLGLGNDDDDDDDQKKEDDDSLGNSESLPSFRAESINLLSLKDTEKKALADLRSKLEEAILKNQLFVFKEDRKDHPEKEKSAVVKEEGEEKEKSLEKEEQGEEKEKKSLVNEGQGEETKEKSSVVDDDRQDREEGEGEKKGEEKGKEENPENLSFAEEIKEAKEKLGLNEEAKKEEEGMKEEEEKERAEENARAATYEVEEDIKLWGVHLLPSKGDKGTDVILLKFLRARDFKSQEAYDMLRRTVKWRRENNIEAVVDEEFPAELSSVAYMQGVDKKGHPICYNIFGTFLRDDIHSKIFGTEEMKHKFLRWRFQLMEKGIKKLDFGGTGGGATSMLQITDLKNSPGPTKKELRLAMKQAVALLQDNYPELVARNIFINVPFWSYAFYAVVAPFFTPRSKSKLDFARPAKVTETLLKYIAPQQIPVGYGGFHRENDPDFSIDDNVTEVTIKSGSSESIEILAPEVGTKFTWETVVLGWEVNYKEEFMPSDEGSYTMIVQKGRKVTWQEGPLRNSFKSKEPGKLVLTIDNAAFKKKRVFYRYKTTNNASSSSSST